MPSWEGTEYSYGCIIHSFCGEHTYAGLETPWISRLHVQQCHRGILILSVRCVVREGGDVDAVPYLT